MKLNQLLTLTTIAACTVFLASCNQSPAQIKQKVQSSHQAIDGYIVNADVLCDDIPNGVTGRAGRFQCFEDTSLVTIRGGSDVGFNDLALSGGTPFIGELQGSGSSPFVTPLTTVAVKMATQNGIFTEAGYQQASELLISAFDLADLDLAMNPLDNLELLRANAQLNTLIIQFSSTIDEYALVTDELATILSTGNPIDLNDDVNTVVSLLNQQLLVSSPELALTSTSEAETVAELVDTNAEIKQSKSPEEIATVVTETSQVAATAFSIDHDAPLIRYYPGGTALGQFSLEEFEDPIRYFGEHRVTFTDYWNERLEISTSAFTINESLTNTTVDAGIEFKSTTDDRQLSVTLAGAKLSMTEDDSQSVEIVVPQDSLLHATGIDAQGVVTNVTTLTDQDQFATSEDGIFSISMYDVNRRLHNNGHPPLFDTVGHFQTTLVISGIRFTLNKSGNLVPADDYTVTNSVASISGHGIRGYISRKY